MRKINPDAVRADFDAAADEVRALYEATIAAMPAEQARISQMAEQSVLMLGVLFEGFVTDLLAAYVNRDSSTLVVDLEQRMRQSLSSRFGAAAVAAISTIAFKAHLDKAESYAVLDKEGRNFSYGDAAGLVGKAGQVLTPAHAAGFVALDAADLAILDAMKLMRHWVAHRSTTAKTSMNDALGSADLPAELQRGTRQINNLGAHLKAQAGAPPTPRVLHYIAQVRRIGAAL